jgi:hypothetical protein
MKHLQKGPIRPLGEKKTLRRKPFYSIKENFIELY